MCLAASAHACLGHLPTDLSHVFERGSGASCFSMDTGEERVPGQDRSPRGRSASSLSSTGLPVARSPVGEENVEGVCQHDHLHFRRSRPKAVDSYDWSRPSHQSELCLRLDLSSTRWEPLRWHHKNPFKFRTCSCPLHLEQLSSTRAMLQAQDERSDSRQINFNR